MRRNKVYESYNEHAKQCDPKDFLGQVKRSINGQAVGQDQLDMIAAAIVDGLAIEPDDFVLDLCCGNGLLSQDVFARCMGGIGVDFADYLINIAQENFARNTTAYVLDDVEHYLTTATECERFTKVLCYSSFQYFSHTTAEVTLRAIRERFPNVRRFFLGNLPDRTRLHDFYFADKYVEGIEDDHESPIGKWRTRAAFSDLAGAFGWKATFASMPETFYAAHYRYDAILTPR